MIIADCVLSVPGRKYKVRINCHSTRRLTTIEWLILNCAKRFANNTSMTKRGLKYAFEEVFQLQNSELIIKPCLKGMVELGVIAMNGEAVEYDDLKFSDIKLTVLGDQMLKEGLLPGESREISLDIYYNPLTGSVSNYDNSVVASKGVIRYGEDRDLPFDFPEDRIKRELQNGTLKKGRFSASKYRIENVEQIVATSWDAVIRIDFDLDEEMKITTSPSLFVEGGERLRELLYTKDVNKELVETMPLLDQTRDLSVLGSAGFIKKSILEVCADEKDRLFLDAHIYSALKRNTSVLKNKTLILFSDENNMTVERLTDGVLIRMPERFDVDGCVAINAKGENVCLARAECKYNDDDIVIPLAIESGRLLQNPNEINVWFKNTLLSQVENNTDYFALLYLPFLEYDGSINLMMRDKLKEQDFDKAVSDVLRMYEIWGIIGVIPDKADVFSEMLVDKIDFDDNEEALRQIGIIMSSSLVKENIEISKRLASSIIEKFHKPQSYSELKALLQSLMITDHDVALLYDEYVDNLYTDEVISDVLITIVNREYKELSEFFAYDLFFNDYQRFITQIEKHVSGLRFFEKSSKDELQKSVDACPDKASLHSYLERLQSCNETLMGNGVNVYDVIRKHNPDRADAFDFNIKAVGMAIDGALDDYINMYNAEHHEDYVTKGDMYIIDTCAVVNSPQLFLYFGNDDYIRIPTKVMDELGKIKDKRSPKYDADTSRTARMIASRIETVYMDWFNKDNEVRFGIENSSPDLLPEDLDPSVPDNLILSVGLKYKEWNVTMITDDRTLRLISEAQGITPISSFDFMALHKDNYSQEKEQELHGTRNTGRQHETAVIKRNTTSKRTINIADVKSVEELPVSELTKYFRQLQSNEISFLSANKIRTIGDFKSLTSSRINAMKAKGKQLIYRNTIAALVERMDEVEEKLKSALENK